MKASVLHKFCTPLNFEEVDDPVCRPKSVVVELKACGVCRSDHHAWSGNDPDFELPHIMGHELAGVIVELDLKLRSFL